MRRWKRSYPSWGDGVGIQPRFMFLGGAGPVALRSSSENPQALAPEGVIACAGGFPTLRRKLQRLKPNRTTDKVRSAEALRHPEASLLQVFENLVGQHQRRGFRRPCARSSRPRISSSPRASEQRRPYSDPRRRIKLPGSATDRTGRSLCRRGFRGASLRSALSSTATLWSAWTR